MHLVTWRIRALGAPRVLRPCPRCDTTRPFASTGRFRVNANGRRLDVWLITSCSTCERTWNHPVHERVSPEALGTDRIRYERNDPELAAAVAASLPAAWLEPPDWEIERSGAGREVVLEVDPGLVLRLDAVLARALGLSRSAVASGAAGAFDKRALRRPVRNGQRLLLARRP